MDSNPENLDRIWVTIYVGVFNVHMYVLYVIRYSFISFCCHRVTIDDAQQRYKSWGNIWWIALSKTALKTARKTPPISFSFYIFFDRSTSSLVAYTYIYSWKFYAQTNSCIRGQKPCVHFFFSFCSFDSFVHKNKGKFAIEF